MVIPEQSKKINELFGKIDFESSNAETKFKELDLYVDGLIDATEDVDEVTFLAQYQVFLALIQRINRLRKQTNQRMDNFVVTTKKISDRLQKLETEINLLRKWQKSEGRE